VLIWSFVNVMLVMFMTLLSSICMFSLCLLFVRVCCVSVSSFRLSLVYIRSMSSLNFESNLC
jgi:hypothetical protein